MAETGAHLIDHVLPHAPYRQWVLTLPPPLRYLVAYDRDLLAVVIGAFQRTLFAHLKHRAKRCFGLSSVDHANPGSVTVIQRAGSALNLNVHLHTLATDGVFIQPHRDATPVFRALPAPSDAEVADVAWHTCLRTLASLRKRGLWLDDDTTDDPLTHAEPALATLARASVTGTLALGPRAGNRPLTLRADLPAAANEDTPGLVQTPGYAFNLHAKRRVPAHDRKALERLCRYFLRPPIANDRLRWVDDNTLALRLTRPWRDGTTHVFFTPEQLVQRMVPLVFPPRVNRIRYHGVFAPNARLRKLVVPGSQDHAQGSACSGHAASSRSGAPTADSRRTRPPRPGWADLMARVFAFDVLECPRCRSRMQRIAFITQPSVIHAFLASVGLPADSPLDAPIELGGGSEIDDDAAA